MAAVSLSPSPVPFSAMSTRRAPLASNPNVANSPLRGSAALAAAAMSKQRRSHASAQREDAYGQPPPAKRQMLEGGATRATLRSPTKQRVLVQRGTARSYTTAERTSHQPAPYKPSEKEVDEVRKWRQNQLARFPKLVFYFESVPDDQRARLGKQIAHLGAREEKFFSIEITHVVTSRPIPPPSEKALSLHKDEHAGQAELEHDHEHEQPQTINPSLLSRTADTTKRKLFETATRRRLPVQAQDDAVRRPKPAHNVDVLHRARDMGKKIWSLEKLHKVLEMLLESDPYRSAALGYSSRTAGTSHAVGASRPPEEMLMLQQLLNKERVNGPSDRDPTVATRELNYFKGPYIYIYDIEEKQKPIMVREYAKVADKTDGEWPQLRSTGHGRCPFIEDVDWPEKKVRARETVTKASTVTTAAAEPVPKLQPPEVAPSKPVTGKRTLAEMEDGHNRRVAASAQAADVFNSLKVTNPPAIDFQPQNAFTSRAKAGRLFAGEPVASGLQPSGITSAIRSQMISSATGTIGARAGTSKEIHGLQRKVLQKSNPTSQDLSSRRMAEMSMDHPSFTRSASLGRTTQGKLEVTLGDADAVRDEKHKRTMSVPTQAPKQKKRDPKPGYCENCQDKFEDFEEHILSRKHRRFAENDQNWVALDSLLGLLKRRTKYDSEVGSESDVE